VTTSGIEPATFCFLAQHLNHCATAVPKILYVSDIIRVTFFGLCDCTIFGVVFKLNGYVYVFADVETMVKRFSKILYNYPCR